MKRKFSRLVSCMLALLLLSGVLTAGVSADQYLDVDRLCTVNMLLQCPRKDGLEGKVPLQGAVIELFMIAKTRYDPKNKVDQILVPYKPYSQDPRIQQAKLWQGIASEEEYKEKLPINVLLEIIEKEKQPPSAISAPSKGNGRIRFTGLMSGVFLVRLRNPEKVDCVMEPFLMTLPRKVGDDYDYDGERVLFEPKTEIGHEVTDILVKKVWKGDEKKIKDRPESITVELMNGKLKADEGVLSAENKWTYVFRNKPRAVNWRIQEKEVPGYKSEVGDVLWENDHYEVTIINTADGSLVQTGELNWPIPVLLILGVLLMGGGWILSSDRRKSGE